MAKRKSAKSVISNNNLTLADISPLTDNQQSFFKNYDTGKSQFLIGYPGTGKTYLSLFKAFKEINDPLSMYQRVVIVRSAVPTRDIGFLPGTEAEKSVVYELPYKKICSELFGRDDAYEILSKHDGIRFMTTSFIRGLTIDNAIIIIDEFQSLSGHELASIITRVGRNSKVIFCGDFAQTDLTKVSEKQGANKFFDIIQHMQSYFDINHFTSEDIVRSGLVKEFIIQQMSLHPDGL